MLTAEQEIARKGKLTASRVAVLMNGSATDIMDLWLEMTNDPSFKPDDLSGVWPVQLGSATEALNVAWFARKIGPVSGVGKVLTHNNGWAACTLDAWSDADECPVECKHVGGHESLQTVIDRYQPQMHWQMIVTGAAQCAFSVIMAAAEPVVEYIPLDQEYAAEMLTRADAFMKHVRNKTQPVILPAVAAPIIPTREVDMSTSNEWGSNAVTWLTTKQAKKDCIEAEAALKALVPGDAKIATGAGIRITKNRAGSMSLREIA